MVPQSRFTSLLILALAVGSVTGCQKYRAENSLQKTAQMVSEIENKYNGTVHEPEKVKLIREQIAQAQSLLETEAGQALEAASQARTEATLLLEAVRPKEATVLLSAANQEIRISETNELMRNDLERHNRIREIIAEANQANSQNKWDDVIRLSKEVITEVATGLAPLKTAAEREAKNADDTLNELRVNQGAVYAPDVVISVQDGINQAKIIFEKDRDYTLARNRFADATAKAENGIVQVRREKSREALERIEGHLSTALIEGAETYKPKEYASALDLFNKLNDQYIQGSYTTVLEGADDLQVRGESLVIETKRAASDDRIYRLDRQIKDLTEGGIADYVDGALSGLDGYLTRMREARTGDNEAAFDQIKALDAEAADEVTRQRDRFQAVALAKIRDAQGALETTRGVFDQMGSIFEPIAGDLTSDEKAFEDQKVSRQTAIRGRLEEANVRFVTAQMREQDPEKPRYREAILLAAEVEELSAEILGDIYHVVANNATIELARLISRYGREGAGQYAPEELARSTAKTEEVKALIAERSYEAAVRRSAEARADVELMAQRIANRATADLQRAEQALVSASSENTRLHRAEALDEVAKLIDRARVDLQADRLGLAVETANQATQLAIKAETEANQVAATASIDEASRALIQAQDAGAELYAGREVEDARKLLASAKTLYDSQDYLKAGDLARSAATRARAGLYKKINEAEAELANAQSVGGWEYDNARLARANADLREARQLIEQKNYAASRAKAATAASTAAGLTNDAKNNNVIVLLSTLRSNLQGGAKEGVNFFQPGEAIDIRRELATLENQYSLENYELTMVQLEKLQARLRGTLDGTEVMVKTVATQQGTRLDELESDGAVQYAATEIKEAREGLRYALLDFERGLYKSAHSNLERSITLIDEVEARKAQESYSKEVLELMAELRAAQLAFDNILSLQPQELKELAVGANGAAQAVSISAQISPTEFRRRVDNIYARALIIKTPAGLGPVQENVIAALAEARISALNFEKLAILNRVSVAEAHHLIDQAFVRMNNSNRIVSGVQSQLVADEVRFRLVSNRGAVTR